MPKPFEKKVLPNGMVTAPPSDSVREAAFGLGGILDLQRDMKALRLLEMAGRRVGGHDDLAIDREAGVHDLVLPARRGLHFGIALAIGKVSSIRAPRTFS